MRTKVIVDKCLCPPPLACGKVSGSREEGYPTGNRRQAVVKRHPLIHQLNPGSTVLAEHQVKGLAKDPTEIPHPFVVPAELLLKRLPVYELRLSLLNAVQTLGQPGIHVQRHR